MKERFLVGDAGAGEGALEAEVEVAPGRVVLHRGGQDRVYAVTAQPDGSVRIVGPDGVHVAWVDGDVVTIAGRSRRVRRAPPSARAVPPVVTPPMPAVVARIHVTVDEVVAARQALVTVTAMKMEVVLRAPHAGRVRTIRPAVGDRVAPGDVLVDIEEGS